MQATRNKNILFWVLRIPGLFFYSTTHLLKISAAVENFRLTPTISTRMSKMSTDVENFHKPEEIKNFDGSRNLRQPRRFLASVWWSKKSG